MPDGAPPDVPARPAASREGPWSLRDISDDAKAAAKSQAKARRMSVGAWVNQAILAQAAAEQDRQVPAVILPPELLLPKVAPNAEIGPLWRWMRRRMGIEPATAPPPAEALVSTPGAKSG